MTSSSNPRPIIPLSILLIDDDDFFRSMLRDMLRELGHEVVEACDGAEGLAWHEKGFFDLVITDLIMPEKEGVETIMTLLQRAPDTRIIAMSGGGRASAEGYLHIASKVGARQVLTKPFTQAVLVAVIDAAMV